MPNCRLDPKESHLSLTNSFFEEELSEELLELELEPAPIGIAKAFLFPPESRSAVFSRQKGTLAKTSSLHNPQPRDAPRYYLIKKILIVSSKETNL